MAQTFTNSLGIEGIVKALREVRIASLEHRHRRNNPPKLPSRKALQAIVDGLSAALFPNRLGMPDLQEDGIDYFVGHTLDIALRELYTQVQLELRYSSDTEPTKLPSNSTALEKVRAFSSTLPKIRQLLDTDLNAAFEGDPAARSLDEVLVCYPGIAAIIHHRLAHELHQLGLPLIARIISELAHSATGIDIHPGAYISQGFFIDHGTGVVIGETAVIGGNVWLTRSVPPYSNITQAKAQDHLAAEAQ